MPPSPRIESASTRNRETCTTLSVPASVECSRSGDEAHIWIFFERPVAAGLARRVGSLLLTRSMERRHQLGLDSYDRLFPNQDTMPKGGFGDLIALPLQKAPRELGRSVFLDEEMRPYEDQWSYLSSVQRMTQAAAEQLISDALRHGGDLIRCGATGPRRYRRGQTRGSYALTRWNRVCSTSPTVARNSRRSNCGEVDFVGNANGHVRSIMVRASRNWVNRGVIPCPGRCREGFVSP